MNFALLSFARDFHNRGCTRHSQMNFALLSFARDFFFLNKLKT